VIGQPPRYSLEEPVFPFPALAAAAGRAALGGPREITLACLMAGRLAIALVDPADILPELHRERADKARHWSGTLAVPGDVRAMLMRVIELVGRCDRVAAATALGDLAAAAGINLDDQSRDELRSVAQKLMSAPFAENIELRVAE
jgi:hypothetical protein